MRGVVADLTSWEDAERLVSEAGPLDVLVNNAGMVQTGVEAPDRLFTELTEAEWDARDRHQPAHRRSGSAGSSRRG